MTRASIIDTLRGVPVAEALTRLGCKPARRRGRMGPCVLCGGDDVQVGDRVWTCYRCGVSLDVPGTFLRLAGSWDGARALAEREGLSAWVPEAAHVAHAKKEAKERARARKVWLDALEDEGIWQGDVWARVQRRLRMDPVCRGRWEGCFVDA